MCPSFLSKVLGTLISVISPDWMRKMGSNSLRPVVLQPLDTPESEITSLAIELVSFCSELDIDLGMRSAEDCVKHLLYVEQVNQYMNLTRITDIHDALILHVVDSLALARALPIDPERFLDMGTGAGFPGIPFALYSDAQGVLLDSVGKKVSACTSFIDALEIEGVQAVHGRCEEYACDAAQSFDIVFARAVGQMALILEYGTPFLEDDGYLVVAKANPENEEITLASKTARICGLDLIGKDEFELPCDMGHREVFLYQKVGDSRIKLPRAVGLAKKQPLVSL